MPITIKNFESKAVGETLPFTYDATDQLPSGVVPSTCVVTAMVADDSAVADASPSSIVSGSATIASNVASQLITAGTDGAKYLLQFRFTLDDSSILDGYGTLLIDSPSPYTS